MKLDPLLTTQDCATLLKVSRVYVWREIDRGRLPAITHKETPRKRYRIRPEDFQAYLDTYWSTGDYA